MLRGGTGLDLLWGGKSNDTLHGGAGHDYLEGGAGADALDGGEGGGDRAGYELSDAGVTVNFATGTAAGGHAEGDTLTNIENLRGSDHADTLTAGRASSFLYGGAGNDVLDGRYGDDELNGRGAKRWQ